MGSLTLALVEVVGQGRPAIAWYLARARPMSYGPPGGLIFRTTSTYDARNGDRVMMPYNSYQLYQIERAKNPAEIRRVDEQAGRLAAAASSVFRGITRPVQAMRRPSPVTACRLPRTAYTA